MEHLRHCTNERSEHDYVFHHKELLHNEFVSPDVNQAYISAFLSFQISGKQFTMDTMQCNLVFTWVDMFGKNSCVTCMYHTAWCVLLYLQYVKKATSCLYSTRVNAQKCNDNACLLLLDASKGEGQHKKLALMAVCQYDA